jgi:hypothetical protein
MTYLTAPIDFLISHEAVAMTKADLIASKFAIALAGCSLELNY